MPLVLRSEEVIPASERTPAVLKDEVADAPKNAGPYAEKRLVEAFENCCSAVQVLAWPRLRPMVRAVPPLYVPLNVRVPSVAERLARLEPRAMPEMVELVRPALLRVPVMAGVPSVNVPPEFVTVCEMVRPLKDVAEDVAKVMAPVCAEPYVWAMEVTPVEDVRYVFVSTLKVPSAAVFTKPALARLASLGIQATEHSKHQKTKITLQIKSYNTSYLNKKYLLDI
jgi:hypothetical protein